MSSKSPKIVVIPFLLGVFLVLGLAIGFWAANDTDLLPPLETRVTSDQPNQDKELPLEQYSIDKLQNYPFQASEITIVEKLKPADGFSPYLFTYTSMGKQISGQLNIPDQLDADQQTQVIILVRGWVPAENYSTGTGTKAAAAVFAKNGYLTLAPDFLGYGQSDPEPNDSWEARFIKPINLIELIKSVRQKGVPLSLTKTKPADQLGIWAHSNGGQITLTALEIMNEPIATTLWAPVTVPFPYSIMFYSDELPDEGKQQRAWIALFEQDYNAFDFSLTKHLNKLTGPLVIHHGTNDEAAPKTWSDEFVAKLEAENASRVEETRKSPSSQLSPIEFSYYSYPGADHNLRPVSNWNTAIGRDLLFFSRQFAQPD